MLIAWVRDSPRQPGDARPRGLDQSRLAGYFVQCRPEGGCGVGVADDDVRQPDVGLVVARRLTAQSAYVPAAGRRDGDWGRGVPFVLAAAVYVGGRVAGEDGRGFAPAEPRGRDVAGPSPRLPVAPTVFRSRRSVGAR